MSGSTNTSGRWEYHVEEHRDLPSETALNALGADRWELVGTTTRNNGVLVLIFKRPTPTLAEQITVDQRTRVQKEQEAGA